MSRCIGNPPIRVASKKPTRSEVEVARVYIPRVITAKVAAQIIGLRSVDPANLVYQRMHRYRKRLGIRVTRSRPKKLPKFAQLSACGLF